MTIMTFSLGIRELVDWEIVEGVEGVLFRDQRSEVRSRRSESRGASRLEVGGKGNIIANF
jgi:hypothetical protein